MRLPGGARPRIAIFTDEPGWHGARLRAWFADHEAEAHFVSLCDCDIDLAAGGSGFRIGPFGAALPDGVFVRGVPGGSLEAITHRLDVLHRLASLGVPVVNSARAIERTVDKGMTSLLLHQHGVPTPVTFVSESLERAREFATRALAAGATLVKKPLFGSQGKGLRRIRVLDDLGYLLPGEVCYLQHFVARDEAPYRDYRVMVIAGRARAAMARESEHWVTNRAQGARCVAQRLEPELACVAEGASAAVGADYAGVDLLRDADGRWLVTEVNGIPAWQGLESATGVDIGAELAALCLRRVEAYRRG
ncbi:MAG: RimK family alpha-L-glutamate ligase [Gammaproteobacteria bacterium]